MRKPSKLKLESFQRGLVQADVAQAAQISETRLSRILNGRVTPTDYELKNLAQALGVKREALDALNKNINGQSDKFLEVWQGQFPKTPDIFELEQPIPAGSYDFHILDEEKKYEELLK